MAIFSVLPVTYHFIFEANLSPDPLAAMQFLSVAQMPFNASKTPKVSDITWSSQGYGRAAFLPVALIGSLHATASSIVPDGTTATSVTYDQGAAVVEIAPADADRTSYNSFTRLDVDASGAQYNNRDVAARTIVNEVTGTDIANLAGPVEVLGTRAHFIVASPNGIVVNGASFINTSDVVLSTGNLSTIEREIAPGLFQTNLVLDVEGGTITIGEGGLTGAMTGLDLIARNLVIGGAVENTNTGRRNEVRLFPGASHSELDTSLSPANPTRAMASVEQSTDAGGDEFLVDISAYGSLQAGRIEVAVSQAGAGVRIAGDLVATRSDVLLSVDGDIEVAGSAVAAGQVAYTATGDVLMRADTERDQAEITAGAGVFISAGGDILNEGFLITGSAQEVQENESSESEADALTGVELTAGGDIVQRSLGSEHLGILFSAAGDLNLVSGGVVENYNGRLLSNGSIAINAEDGFLNTVLYEDVENRGVAIESERKGSRLWFTLFSRREKKHDYRIDYGELQLPDELALVVATEGIDINAPVVRNIGGEINANGGDVSIRSNSVWNEAWVTGSAYYKSRCGFGCDREGRSTIQLNGGAIQAAGAVMIEAESQFSNVGGTVIGLSGVSIESPEIETQAITLPFINSRPKGLTGFFDYGDARIYRQDQGGGLIANGGTLELVSDEPVRIVGGYLEGEAIETPAGQQIVREPIRETPVFGDHIGVFWKGD